MTTPVRVGDELRFTGEVQRTSTGDNEYPVEVMFAGAEYSIWLKREIIEAAERLPRKLAVGDRVVHRANDKPKPVGVIRYIDPDDWAALVWDHGPRGWYSLSDLRLSDDGEGK